MNEEKRKELEARAKKWRKDEQHDKRVEKSRLYWIFDPRIEETHRLRPRDTQQAYRHARIRYFFSWESLSKFLLAPVFKVSLASIIITPFFTNLYIFGREKLENHFSYSFSTQMGILFFSGLLVVIARAVYELSCPRLIRAHISNNLLDIQNLQNKQWLQMELEYCFLQYVRALPMSAAYFRRKLLISQIEQKTNESGIITSPVLELAHQQVGFDVYGVWLIENLLLRITKRLENKLFIRRATFKNFTECQSLGQLWNISYTALYHAYFCIVDNYKAENAEYKEGDFLLEYYEASHHQQDDFPQGALIHNYFSGIHKITDLRANDIVKEFIAENENYWNPFKRIIIVILLVIALIFLLMFLIIQTMTVCKAIYSSLSL